MSTNTKDKTFRVEIVSIKTGEVVKVIGRGLSEEKAETREETGISRIDTDNYFVQSVAE